MRRVALALCFWLLVPLHPVRGQGTPATSDQPTAAATAGDPAGDDIGAKRAELAGEVEKLQQMAVTATAEVQDDLARAVELLQRIDFLYGQQLAAWAQEKELASAAAQAQAELNTLRVSGVAGKPPYPFLLLNGLQDDLERERGRLNGLDANVAAATEALTYAKDLHTQREQARRRAKEKRDTNADPAAAGALDIALRRRELESRAGAELVRVRELELANERRARETHDLRVAFLHEKAERVRQKVRFSNEELQEQLTAVAKEKEELARALETARGALEAADKKWAKVRQRQDLAANPSRVLIAEVAARRATVQTAQRHVSLLELQAQLANQLEQVWTRRFRVIGEQISRAEVAEWGAETHDIVLELRREERATKSRLAEVRKEALNLSQEIDNSAGEAGVVEWLNARQQQLQERIRDHERQLEHLERGQREEGKLEAELEARAVARPVRERLGDAWDRFARLWTYELTSVDDQSITVGKILAAIVLLSLGLFVSRFVSRQLGTRVLPRLGIEAGAAAALQSLAFYLLMAVLALWALHTVNVPLTVFTLLGGAVAIGVGFGSQNIINNFISGVILLFEQPIKVGDIIDIDGTSGTVEDIGARSTRVRAPANIHIIVPNSTFLEKKVINWTLTDDRIATTVSVRVAYGSPTREVARLLRKAVREHPRVLPAPEPVVVFTEFGADTMLFEVNFWIRLLQGDAALIRSDVRHRIDDLFREAGIHMTAPRRDVRLVEGGPLDVRLSPLAKSE